MKGTRVGGFQAWTYGKGRWIEKKYKPQHWKFDYKVNKSQKRRGHFPVGGRIRWKITAYQDVYKDRDNHYRTHMHGYKRLVSKKIPKRR